MPMPRPNAGERKQQFIERFMRNPSMVKDFPDPAQRMAVAREQWERRK